MKREDGAWSEAIDACRREVRRCQANLDAGGPRDFWVRRLSAAKEEAEKCVAILGAQLSLLAPPAVPPGSAPQLCEGCGGPANPPRYTADDVRLCEACAKAAAHG